jgi:hypothetical protein
MIELSTPQLGWARPAALGVLLLYAVFGWSGLRLQSITYDEPAHWRYGIQVLRGDSTRFDDSKMPVTALNAAGMTLAQKLFPTQLKTGLGLLQAARIPTLLAACLLGWIVFSWAGALYGAGAALTALVFFVLDPNLRAHSQWVTTDLYAALGITAALYAFWNYLRRPNSLQAVLAGALLGAAQLAKFTSVYLYFLLPLIAVVYFFTHKTDQQNRPTPSAIKILVHALLITAISLSVLAAGYLGNGWGTALNGYEFKSALFLSLQDHAGVLAQVPLPFPKPFIEGLDWVRFYEQTASGRGPSYLWGQAAQGSISNYYAWVFGLKVPLGAQILFLWALVSWGLRQLGRRGRSNGAVVLVLPMIFFAVYFNYICEAQMGIRMILPIFPLLYILAASVMANLAGSKAKFVCVGALAGWAALSSLSSHPHELSYFNELAGKPKRYFRILADSNLEWGQNTLFIKEYAKKNPGLQIDPIRPRPGRVAISANFLTGIVLPERFAATRRILAPLEPAGSIANGAYLVYDLSSGDLT